MIKSSFDFYVTINGRKVTEYPYNADTFIEGRKGSEYEIVFQNYSQYTKKIVVSVDGLNVITGNRDWQRGYVVGPYNQISIPGFKRDNGRAAAFTFSSVKDSYNQHNGSGEIQNIGVIGCMIFDEIVPRPRYNGLESFGEVYTKGGVLGNPRGTFSAVAMGASGQPNQAYSVNSISLASLSVNDSPTVVTQSLGTEFGSDVEFKTHKVNKNFQDTAEALLTLYYDDSNGLQRRGIVLTKVEPSKPNPFPGFENYCPDPIK